jgi:capsular exopolysaccharide synthesis family protein
MSRVFEALQRSQVENPNASPLAQGQPDGMPAEVSPQGFAPGAVAVAEDANWLKVPAERVLRPSPRPEQRLVSVADPNSPGAEMFRVLGTRLAHMQSKRRLQKLLITSSVGEEGKSVVAVNLAFTLARRSTERVLLIEADLRRPTASALLTNSQLPGISDWAEGKLSLDDALYRVNDLPFWFLSAGRSIDDPNPLLESARFAKMLETISSTFDWVLLDATPMLPMADSISLCRLCDGVLVVVREGFTRRKLLNKALESIDKNKLLGTVLNEASMLDVGYERYYGAGSSNGSGKDTKKKESKREANQVKAATA